MSTSRLQQTIPVIRPPNSAQDRATTAKPALPLWLEETIAFAGFVVFFFSLLML